MDDPTLQALFKELTAAKDEGVTAPFNFVQLPTTIGPNGLTDPAQADDDTPPLPSHATPVALGLNAKLSLELDFETPVLVGVGKRQEMYIDGDKAIIPGATVRGLLRSLLEIVTASRMEFIEDRGFAIRNQKAQFWKEYTHYKVATPGQPNRLQIKSLMTVPTAVLTKQGKRWFLTPLKQARQVAVVDAAQLADLCGSPPFDWRRNMPVADKTDSLFRLSRNCQLGGEVIPSSVISGLTPQVRHGRGARQSDDWKLDEGDVQYWRFIASGGIDSDPSWLKKTEYFFACDEAGLPLNHAKDRVEISAENAKRFIDAHAISDRGPGVRAGLWHYWNEHPTGTQGFEAVAENHGVPVFLFKRNAREDPTFASANELVDVLQNDVRCVVMALSRYPRIAQGYSTRSLTGEGERPENALDFTEALMGHVHSDGVMDSKGSEREAAKQAWRSRVTVGEFQSNSTRMTTKVRADLRRPRASFHPFYVRNADTSTPPDYTSNASRLAGRKRYIPRGKGHTLPIIPDTPEDQRVELSFLDASPHQLATFRGDIHLKNISLVELGAVIFALSLGEAVGEREYSAQSPQRRHMIGRAKAHGYGQAKLASLRLRARSFTADAGTPSIDEALDAFKQFIERTSGQSLCDQPWVRDLLAQTNLAMGAYASHSGLLVFPNVPAANAEEAVLKGYQEIKSRSYQNDNVLDDSVKHLPAYPTEK